MAGKYVQRERLFQVYLEKVSRETNFHFHLPGLYDMNQSKSA
jgi:hypothetical protein